MAAVEVPQTLEYRGGQLNAAPVLEVENFTNWKKRFMCHIISIELQFENIIKNGPFILMVTGQIKPEGQWTADERKAANLDHRLKSLIMSVLLDDQMNSVINCLTAKSTWDDLILNTNHVKDFELASLFGKLKYKENLIDSIYETKKNKSIVSATPLSTAFFSTSIVHDFQDSPGDEEDTRSSHEYLNNLEEEYQARALLAKSKRLFKRVLKVPSYQSPFQSKSLSSPQHKPDVRPTKDFEAKYNKVKAKLALLNEEEVSSDDIEMVEVKVLMALAKDNDDVSKEGARNGEWVKISMRKILKENKNLRTELKELTAITETWLNSFNKVNQCISEKISFQNKRILGVDQLTEDPSSSGQKDLVFVKSLAVTQKILPAKSQRNTTDPSVAITDSSATDYDYAYESSVCSTPLPPLKKLDGAEPISRPKTIKLILRIISLEREINLRNPQHAFKRCEVCGSSTHTTTYHYDIEWFKRGGALQAKKDEALKSTRAKSSNANRSKTPTKSGCSRHMTGVKSYLYKYVEQPGPKLVFGDDSTCTTEGYGSIKCNDIVFTKVAFVDGLKYNLIIISQLCDAKYIIQFDEKRGTIFNSNKEVVMIAPRVRDVYVLDTTSSAQESCFFAKAVENLNWLWHKILAHLNFKTINKLAKQNLVIGLPSLVYSKDKPCSSCEKGKHHRANFKTKQTSSIKKCLHLLHIDLFGPVTPRFINHEKYTLVIIDEYSRYTWVYFLKKKSQAPETIMSFIKRVENQNDIKVKQLRTNNGTEFRISILVNFCDKKGISQNFSSPYTLKQNGVAETRNRTLIEAARTMLSGSVFSKQY
ncbi:retrovirus-related pol polyprotein from transposon TNT 1-94 [Tanacetum coccineum]